MFQPCTSIGVFKDALPATADSAALGLVLFVQTGLAEGNVAMGCALSFAFIYCDPGWCSKNAASSTFTQ